MDCAAEFSITLETILISSIKMGKIYKLQIYLIKNSTKKNSEQPLEIMIKNIENSEEGIVSVIEGATHSFQTNDKITIKEVVEDSKDILE